MLQSVVGSLNFIRQAIPAGRAFNLRFYDAMSFVKSPHHFVRLSAGMRDDLKTWFMFLQNFSGYSIFNDYIWSSSENLWFYTDAAGSKELGCGTYFQGKWSVFKWPEYWEDIIFLDITYLELITIIFAFCIWGPQLKGKSIMIRSDNCALLDILNKQNSKNKQVVSYSFLVLYLIND